MPFGASSTYIYAYIVFASVYLIASFAFVASAVRVSSGLVRSRSTKTDASAASTASPASTLKNLVGHGQRIIDYAQLATLLPLVYIVGSLFLGSMIARDIALARLVNVSWVSFTVMCALVIIVLAVLGIRESGEISQSPGLPDNVSGQAPEALQRVGVRLNVSAALLLLVAVFTMLNLWSIISSLDALSAVDFLL